MANLHAQGITDMMLTANMLAPAIHQDDRNVEWSLTIQLLLCASMNTRSRHFIRQHDTCRIHHVPIDTTSTLMRRLSYFYDNQEEASQILGDFLTEAKDIELFSHICFWYAHGDDDETHFLLLDGEAALTTTFLFESSVMPPS